MSNVGNRTVETKWETDLASQGGEMSDSTESRRKFFRAALVSAGAVMGTLAASTLARGQGVRIGKSLMSFGDAEAAGECSSASDCSGGGGKCGYNNDCAGGGGNCGYNNDCAGGGGKCGYNNDCAGS